MTSPKRSLLIGIAAALCVAFVTALVVLRSPDSAAPPGSRHDLETVRRDRTPAVSRTGQGIQRVRLKARVDSGGKAMDELGFPELWLIVEDDQADDMSKESAALKLAARGGPDAIARLWHVWQAGKLPSSCSWICDMVSKETAMGGTGEVTAGGESRTNLTPKAIAAAIAKMMDPEALESSRLQALRQLGAAATTDALAALETVAAGRAGASDEVRAAAFEALAAADSKRAASALSTVLSQQAVAAELLVAFLEALGDEPTEGATAIALDLLSHENSDVRDEAAWVLSVNAADYPATREVLAAVQVETDPSVRARLFSALGPAASSYASQLLALAQREDAVSVRVAGYQTLAQMASANPSGQAGRLFDESVVPELSANALNAPEYSIRYGSFLALRMARTAGAATAIRRLAVEASDQRIAAAATAATQ